MCNVCTVRVCNACVGVCVSNVCAACVYVIVCNVCVCVFARTHTHIKHSTCCAIVYKVCNCVVMYAIVYKVCNVWVLCNGGNVCNVCVLRNCV